MKKVLFRADGYSDIGYGHIMRSLALAEEFIRQGDVVYFLSFSDDFCRDIIEATGAEYIKSDYRAGDRRDLKKVNNYLFHLGIDIFIHDSYSIDADYERKLCFNGLIIAIDDTAERQFYSDVIINQNYGAEKYRYDTLNPNAKLLLGSRYVMLRDNILKYRKKEIRDNVENILVMFGGTDLHSQTLRVTKILSKFIEKDIVFNVVISSRHPTVEALQALAQKDGRISLIHNVSDMGSLMYNMDIAISASGSSLWELLYVGVPVVSIIFADNQKNIAKNLSSDGYIKMLGWYNKISDDDILKEVKFLMENFDERNQLFERGQELIDGRGRRHLVDSITVSVA